MLQVPSAGGAGGAHASADTAMCRCPDGTERVHLLRAPLLFHDCADRETPLGAKTIIAGVLLALATVLVAKDVRDPVGTITDAPAVARPGNAGSDQALSRIDRGFLIDAARSSQAEIEAAELAERVSSHADVKRFARRMIEEHGKAADDLAALAKLKGVDLPDTPSVAQRTELTALKALSGHVFDKTYASRLGVRAHEKTLATFRTAVNRARDPDVKEFATRQLPLLQRHLEEAQALRAAVGRDR